MKKTNAKIRSTLKLSAPIVTLLAATLLSGCGGGGGGGGDSGGGDGGSTNPKGVTGGKETTLARTAQAVFIRAKDAGRPMLLSVADDGGSQPLTLASSDLFSAIGQFALSPDKGHLAFIADGGLYVVKADGSGLVRLSELNNAAGKVTDFQWSPDGTSLVYLADGEVTDQYELYQVQSDGSDREEKRRISGPFGIRTTLDVAAPQWSPDGRYVAYLVLDNGRAIGLNTHDTTSTDPRDSVRVSSPTVFATWQDIAGAGAGYQWSPDSHYLAYRSDALRDNLYEIFTVHPDGSDLRRANGTTVNTVYVGGFGWSPDSRYLAESFYYIATGNYVGLNTWDMQDISGVPSRRVASAGHLVGFTWAHHDARLAFVDDHVAAGIPELFVHDPRTMSTVKVNHGGPSGEGVEEFDWSPNDRYLGYITKSGLYRATSGSSDPSQALFTYGNTEHIFGGWAWSPDEEQVAYWVFSNPSNLSQGDAANLYISATASPDKPFLALGPHTAIELPLIQWSDDSQVLVAEIEGGVFSVNGPLNYSLSGSYQTAGFKY